MPQPLNIWFPVINSTLYNAVLNFTELFIIVQNPQDAAYIIFENDDPEYIKLNSTFNKWPHKCIVVSETDMPTYYLPGCYASNKRGLLSKGRSQTIPYLISLRAIPNPFIKEIKSNPTYRYFYSFKGGSTSWLRKKLFKNKPQNEDVCIEESNHYFHWTYDVSYMDEKMALQKQYATLLEESLFFICPKGAGVGSIRLFEVIQAGRVPVIISDDWIPIENIPWDEFSIRIAEKDITQIDSIIRSYANNAKKLGTNAKKAWDNYFSPAKDMTLLYTGLKNIQSSRNEKKELLIRSLFPLIKGKKTLKEKGRSFAKMMILKSYVILGKEFPYSLNRPISEQVTKK